MKPIPIVASSAITAVGDTVEETCASLRAGISRRREHEHVCLPKGEGEGDPLFAATVGSIDPSLGGAERLLALLAPVLADLATRGALGPRELGATALLVALPFPDEAVAAWRLDDAFLAELGRRAGLSFAVTRHRSAGHAGAFDLLGEANALFADRAVESCIVAGVDAYPCLDRLRVLDAAYRIKSDRNVDGFCPGEAASALLLESPWRSRPRVPAQALVTGLGTGDEPETVRSDRPSTGAGLTRAIREALPDGRGAAWVACDLNGESWRSFEWGVALTRLGDRFEGLKKLAHPAISLGDVGAAIGPLLAASVIAAFQRGYAPADEALLWASSDGGLRGAARIQRA